MTPAIKAGTKIYAEDGEYLFTVLVDLFPGGPINHDWVEPPAVPFSPIDLRVLKALWKAAGITPTGLSPEGFIQ